VAQLHHSGVIRHQTFDFSIPTPSQNPAATPMSSRSPDRPHRYIAGQLGFGHDGKAGDFRRKQRRHSKT
jgi:hypothetical protein